MMHKTKKAIIRKLALGASTFTGLRISSSAKPHVDDLVESGHIKAQMQGRYMVYSLTAKGEALENYSAPEADNIVPPRQMMYQPCNNVAPWLKAPALRLGADDFLKVPSLCADGRHYRVGAA